MQIQNPIRPGFHPDPSICRVGEDYYLVNSSFEYFPGVPIHHSRDLIHWRQIGYCLTRPSQLPLDGVKDSDGIYAPTLRYHDGRFYMVTTNVRGGGNFYVSADDPAGEWSEPIWLKQSGIDPCLFFENGKTYLTGNGTFWNPVRGLYQSEIDIRTGEQLTETRFLWPGSGGAYVEGPRLFRRGEYYYLMAAEGGTHWCHMATLARSKTPFGPFEPCPHNPILTQRSLMNDIQGTGHADFIEDHHGNWWIVFLGIRAAEYCFHNLGRETFIAPVEWNDDGWPVVNAGERIPMVIESDRPMQPHPWPEEPVRDDFDAPKLRLCWNYLRNPDPADYALCERPGWLRLRCAAASLDDEASPAFLCRRQQHFEFAMTTCLDFQPGAQNEEAGLSVRLDHRHHGEVAVTRRNGQRVAVLRRRIGSMQVESAPVVLAEGPVSLCIAGNRLHYTFTANGVTLGQHELRYLSTEVAGGYTGAMLGLYATGRGTKSTTPAWFDWAEYQPTPSI
jgi:alpha-N-arabinofuranosidase